MDDRDDGDRQNLRFDDFELWHHVTCRSYSVTECRFEVQAPFQAKLLTRSLGEMTIGEASTSSFASIRLRRGAQEVRKDQVNDFMALHIVNGAVGFAQGGRSLDGRTGDLFLYDQSQPFAFDIVGRHHLEFMAIPRAAMTDRIAYAEHLTARALPRDAKLGGLARTAMHQMLKLGALNPPSAERLGTAVLEVVAAAFDTESNDTKLARRHVLLKATQAYMRDHLADNDLDLERIASALGVAPRTLTRIFTAEGVTPMRWLWQQRLAASREGLSSNRFATVTEAAISCGFGDLSHFSRLFKQAFGVSPSIFVKKS